MIPKDVTSVADGDIQSLVTNSVPEGRTIDYKQALPGTTDADKKEFLADVSSFANTSGGDLLFGISESQGVPTGICGIGTADVDLEIRRMDNMIATGLDPRIRHHIKAIQFQNGERVLLVRVDRSWIGPHRVIFKGHDKFYARNSAGKYPLDVPELRAAFTFAASVTDRIRAFRTDRIIELTNNRTPVPFVKTAKTVLHCIPIEAFSGQAQFDVLQFYNDPARLRPIRSSGWSRQINLDGVVAYDSPEEASSYAQVYRNGIIEAVHGGLLEHEYQGRKVIPYISSEQAIFKYLPTCFQILQTLGCNLPVVVALTLIGVRGLCIAVDTFFSFESGHSIDRDTLVLPEAVVDDFNTPVGTILKPMFDLVWNACGYPESKNFDSSGNWISK